MSSRGRDGRPERAGREARGARTQPPALKRFGQHFLTDARVLDRIVEALELTGTETVLEIGPGRGALTDRLVERAGRLVAVELDRALAARLRERYAGAPHVEIVEQDVLDVELAAVAGGPYVLVGNVPYYITTPILFHALRPPWPLRSVYLVQREVGERLAAPAGDREYGALSVNVQAVATVEQLLRVPPGAFRPPPSVESAVVRLRPRAEPVVGEQEIAAFRAFVQACFGLRRKQLRRVLRTVTSSDAAQAERWLAAAALDPDARPETLSPAAFARLHRAVRATQTGREDEVSPGS